MNALPHIGQTRRNRRDLRILTGAASYAEHQHYTDESLRWEMERAARTELLPVQPEPAMFCAPVEDEPAQRTQLDEDFVIGVMGVAALALLAIAFTWGLPA